MRNLFQEIQDQVPRIPGWCSVGKAWHLASMVVALKPAYSVEIGVYAGRSSFPIAAAHRYIGSGKLIAIDPWSSTEAVKFQGEEDRKYWGNQTIHANAEDYFNRLISANDLHQWVDIRKCTSDEVEVDFPIGLLHIDGNHSEQASKDVRRFAIHVHIGGFCVMDDLDWSNKGPADACKLLPPLGFIEVDRKDFYEPRSGEKDNYAVYQRIAQ